MTGGVLIEYPKPAPTVGAARLQSWTILVKGEDASKPFLSLPETPLLFVVEADQGVGDRGEQGLEWKVVG